MTNWAKIDKTTREFTDESYKPLHTPSEYFYTPQQKAKMEEERMKKLKKQTEDNIERRENEKTR